MPVCFQLTPIGEKEPKGLNEIDREICNLLGEEFSDKTWCIGWYDLIGFRLACGKLFSQIRDEYQLRIQEMNGDTWDSSWCEKILKVVDYLESKYTPDSWREVGKRS